MSGGYVNTWTYTPGSGPDADTGPGIERLDFSPAEHDWPACSRNNGSANPDSIGVEHHLPRTTCRPRSAASWPSLGGTQAATITIVDTTVMALNPTS